jgi:cysteinyl-tRNA synthetase
MNISLHNTLKGKKEIFEPIKPAEISMYNCGPTVYNYAHIGNLRSYIFADILRRMFEYNEYKVKQIINITDIGHLSSDNDEGEDKMTKALKREGKPLTLYAMHEVANFYFEKFKGDLTDLNIEMPEKFPFASDHIIEDIELIEKLSKNGFTYKTSDGIYFEVDKFPDYGILGGLSGSKTPKIDNQLDVQSRIGWNNEKRNQRDFALWKFNDELGYESPFGKGFPGWHIECSAMSVKYLGPEFDIHTGGIDHIPVHHNNEIAQAVCAGYPYAHYWMHNAFLTVGSEKMAKSEDNFITLQTLKDKGINPLAYRYLLLTARYSSPLQFSWEALEGAQTAWSRIREFLSTNVYINREDINHGENPSEIKKVYYDKFKIYINDDLDTPKCIALIYEIISDTRLCPDEQKELILNFDKVLGLRLDETKIEKVEIPENVQKLVEKRNKARSEKDFVKSDKLRQEIESLGFEVKDTPEGSEITPK